MSLSANDTRKVRRLIALSLDARGQKAEADAAGLKAIRLCRAAEITTDEFAAIFGLPPTPEPQPEFRPSPFEDAFSVGIQAAMSHIFEDLAGSQRRRRA